MNNEEKILAILEKMQTDLADVKREQSEMKHDLSEMKKKLDVVVEQTANLTEFKTEMNRHMKDLIAVVKENTYDIVKLKAAL